MKKKKIFCVVDGLYIAPEVNKLLVKRAHVTHTHIGGITKKKKKKSIEKVPLVFFSFFFLVSGCCTVAREELGM